MQQSSSPCRGNVLTRLALRMRIALFTAALVSGSCGLVYSAPSQAEGPRKTIALSSIPADRLKESDWAARHDAILERIKENPDTTLVLIGDSITQNYEKANPPYENFLPIWQQFYAPEKAINLGFSGDTTENVLWRLDHGEVDGINPKAAIILVGTNNIGTGSAVETESGIDAVVAKVEEKLPSSSILLLGLLPRDGSLAEVTEINRYLANRYGKDAKVTFIDIGFIFYKDGTLNEDLYYDPKEYHAKALHPDTVGQRMMAEAIEPALMRLLGEDLHQYQPSPENLKARQEFQDAKFGMFIHWGIYSVLGDGEWVFHNRKLTVDQYDLLPKFFDPEKFDPKAWVALAKSAGMKYITITSRHHDGFAMFDSKVSDWNIVQRTPYGKDPLKMLAEECHRQGIKLFFYYSQLDWHNPDYYPRGKTAWDMAGPIVETGTSILTTTWMGNCGSCSPIMERLAESGSMGCGTNLTRTGIYKRLIH